MINPIITFDPGVLLPGEEIVPLNPYTNQGYVIKPYYFVTSFGRYFSTASGRFEEKMLHLQSDGYLDLNVITDIGQKHLRAHRGVLASFNPVPNMYELQVGHKDGNPQNNNLSNLQWGTSQEIIETFHMNGNTNVRSRTTTDDDVINVVRLAADGYTDEEICQILSHLTIGPETVRMIRTGQGSYTDVLKRLGIEPVLMREHSSLTEDDYQRVIDLHNLNYSSNKISEITGIRPRTVRGIITRYKQKLENPAAEYKPKLVNPIIVLPEEYSGLELYPVNIYTSPLYTLVPLYWVTKDGRLFSHGFGGGNTIHEMKIGYNKKGYAVVGLRTDKGTKAYFVHRIVLATFNPVPNMYELEGNHKNGNHADCRLENLEWTTHSENIKHASQLIIQNRTPQRAPDEDIIQIVNLAHSGKSDEEISTLMNGKYSVRNVKVIRSGLKTYGPVLESLGLTPYKQYTHNLDQSIKDSIYNYIQERIGTKGYAELCMEASEVFGVSYSTARRCYDSKK